MAILTQIPIGTKFKVKETVFAIIVIQVILAIMPVYHATVEAIPTNPAFFVIMAVSIALIVMFYMESKKNVITSDEEEWNYYKHIKPRPAAGFFVYRHLGLGWFNIALYKTHLAFKKEFWSGIK